jgi:hypothetical protein
MFCKWDYNELWWNAHNLYWMMRLDPKMKSTTEWLLEPPFHVLCVKGTTLKLHRMQRMGGHDINNIFTNVGHTKQQCLFLPPQELVLFNKSHPIEELQAGHYYQPIHGSQASFNSFIYDPIHSHITMFQVTDVDKHSLKPLGSSFLLKLMEQLHLPSPEFHFVFVILEGNQVRCAGPKAVKVSPKMFFLGVSEANLFFY